MKFPVHIGRYMTVQAERSVVGRHNMPPPLQVVTWTASQSFQLGGHNTLIVHWTLTSL